MTGGLIIGQNMSKRALMHAIHLSCDAGYVQYSALLMVLEMEDPIPLAVEILENIILKDYK